MYTGGKRGSTVLNACRAKEFVAQSTLTRWITCHCYFLLDVPGTFFNATHQVKAIAIAISKANPLAVIGWLLWCVHCTSTCFPSISLTSNKELSPNNTHFYMAFYLLLNVIVGITFTRPVFCLKLTMTMVL